MRIMLFGAMGILLMLSGCIIVNNFNEYWEHGTRDPALDGVWHMPNSQRPALVFSPSDKDYYVTVPDDVEQKSTPSEEHARTLTIGSHTFLMIKTTKEQLGGDLVLYTVKEDKLTLYAPVKSKRESFEKSYAGTNIETTSQTARIKTLDVRTVRILQSLAAKPDYWQVTGTYYREEMK